MHRSSNGVSLVELLVVLVIVGILAALAIPSYQNYVARSARAAARAALMEDVQFMERKYTQSNCYQCVGEPIGNIALPKQQSPDTGNVTYQLSLTDASTDVNTYLLVATRAGAMAGDECGDLTINQLGQKQLINQAAGVTAAACWAN